MDACHELTATARAPCSASTSLPVGIRVRISVPIPTVAPRAAEGFPAMPLSSSPHVSALKIGLGRRKTRQGPRVPSFCCSSNLGLHIVFHFFLLGPTAVLPVMENFIFQNSMRFNLKKKKSKIKKIHKMAKGGFVK